MGDDSDTRQQHSWLKKLDIDTGLPMLVAVAALNVTIAQQPFPLSPGVPAEDAEVA
jgi:hypothetical protein